MPDLPPGALQDLIRELHTLHQRAGYPSARDLRPTAGGAVSHTKIHHTFTKPALPSWGALDMVVEQLAIRARPRIDVEAEINRFKKLWDAADEQVRLADTPASRPSVHLDIRGDDSSSLPGRMCLPIYVVLDTSSAMAARIDILNECLLAIYDALYMRPGLMDAAWLSILSFNERAHLVTPLTDIQELEQLPRFEGAGPTHYGPMVELIHEVASRDVEVIAGRAVTPKVLDPVVCVVTAGEFMAAGHNPPDDWPALQVVAYGFAGANRSTLETLGTRAAYVADTGTDPDKAWSAIADNLAASLDKALETGQAEFPIYTRGLIRLR
ncbi:hypothetical protein OOK27_22285 [Streptomyces canus]|uniref:vWA domain-containing protein n=1 Tax=Streptomyces canus TaxID=58343 RepID=UPI002258407F|nr:hypothetical protein [Streptomyces canus]MCX5256827.1 hypothetical protein [Streptomyces canus]